jgi:hypothetical protein
MLDPHLNNMKACAKEEFVQPGLVKKTDVRVGRRFGNLEPNRPKRHSPFIWHGEVAEPLIAKYAPYFQQKLRWCDNVLENLSADNEIHRMIRERKE